MTIVLSWFRMVSQRSYCCYYKTRVMMYRPPCNMQPLVHSVTLPSQVCNDVSPTLQHAAFILPLSLQPCHPRHVMMCHPHCNMQPLVRSATLPSQACNDVSPTLQHAAFNPPSLPATLPSQVCNNVSLHCNMQPFALRNLAIPGM